MPLFICCCPHKKRGSQWQALTEDDRRCHRAPFVAIEDKGALQMFLLCVVLCQRGRFWAVAGPVPNHGRQRPLTTHIHRGNNHGRDVMACFAARRKGGLGWSGVSLLMFWPLVLCQPRAKCSTVDATLDFNGSANEGSTKKGTQPIIDESHSLFVLNSTLKLNNYS